MADPANPTPTGNQILDRLPEGEAGPLLSSSKTVSLRNGREVYRQGGPLPHAYFPVDGVTSVLIYLQEGERIETGTIGNEGMLGLSAYLGLDRSPYTAVVQVSGKFIQVPVDAFLRVTASGGPLDRLLSRYTAYRMQLANQGIACNTLHSVEERLCRWLLMTQDRVGREEFPLTHEFLAEMLGVRRPTVTLIAGTLQRAGLITYTRGVVRVLDRAGVEAATCECYRTMRETYERIMR